MKSALLIFWEKENTELPKPDTKFSVDHAGFSLVGGKEGVKRWKRGQKPGIRNTEARFFCFPRKKK